MRITKKEAEALFSQGLLADEMSWRIEKAMTRVCTCLESVEQTVSELEKNLPAQQGFFSGKCDMRAYYPIVCDCLMRIERQSGTLREALIELTSVEAFVAERREEGLRAEALLLEAGERAYAEGLLQGGIFLGCSFVDRIGPFALAESGVKPEVDEHAKAQLFKLLDVGRGDRCGFHVFSCLSFIPTVLFGRGSRRFSPLL